MRVLTSFLLSIFIISLTFSPSTAYSREMSGLNMAAKYGYFIPDRINLIDEVLSLYVKFKKIPLVIKVDSNGETTTEGELPEELNMEASNIDGYMDSLWQSTKWEAFLSDIDRAEPKSLVTFMRLFSNRGNTQNQSARPNTVIKTNFGEQLASLLQFNSLTFKIISAVFEKADISSLLQATNYKPELAERSGFAIDISDPEVDHDFWMLASFFILFPEKTRSALRKLPKETQDKWRQSNGINGDTRLEPYDVLLARIRLQVVSPMFEKLNDGLLYAEDTTSMVRFGQMLDKYMERFFDSNQEVAAAPSILRTDLFSESYSVVCLSPYSEFEFELKGLKHSVRKNGNFFQYQPMSYKEGNGHWYFSCADKKFEIVEQAVTGDKIELPKTPKLGGKLKAVAALSLTGEMTENMLKAGMVYLRLLGFGEFQTESVENLKENFLDRAKNSDVVIPIGHSFGFGKIKLGQERGTIVHAKKKVGSTTIELSTYFPPVEDFNSLEVYLDADDMGAILSSGDNHKTIFTMSCWSESSIDAWMLSYRKAEKSGLNPKAPFVFASRNGYSTSNPFVILSHLDAPVHVLENIAKKKTYTEIFEALNGGFRRSIPGRISLILAESKSLGEEWSWTNFGKYIGVLMAPQIFHYQPVANFIDSQHLDGITNAAEIELYDRETGELIGSF